MTPQIDGDPSVASAHALEFYGNGLTFAQPGVFTHRNAFGQPAALLQYEGDKLQEAVTFRYDALGRVAIKDVPAAAHVSRRDMAEGIVIDVGAPADKRGPGHLQCRTVEQAVDQINSIGKQHSGPEITVYLHPSGTDYSLFEALRKLPTVDPRASQGSGRHSYPRVTFQPAWYVRQWQPEYTSLLNISSPGHPLTIRGFRLHVTSVADCPDVTFDGCTFFSGVTVKGVCPRLQFQNCDFATTCTLLNLERSTVLLNFNTFENVDPAIDIYWDDEGHELAGAKPRGKVRVGIYDNIFETLPDGPKRTDPWRVAADKEQEQEPDGQERKGAPEHVGFHLLTACNTSPLWSSSIDGTADLSAHFRSHPPVLWDRERRIRDAKLPTVGPVEKTKSSHGTRVRHRYLYEGSRLAQRNTYRGLSVNREATDVTRFISTFAGGPMFYSDSDGTVDVQLCDHYPFNLHSEKMCPSIVGPKLRGPRHRPVSTCWLSGCRCWTSADLYRPDGFACSDETKVTRKPSQSPRESGS